MTDETVAQPAQHRMTRRELVDLGVDAVDASRARGVAISTGAGGLAFTSAMEVLEFAKMMAISGSAVPAHCRANPGTCLALTMQAIEWRMSPFAVAQKSYVVKDRIGYESQLIHAVIEARAPIKTRLMHRYEGEGDNRKCFVFATFIGETEPREWPPQDSANEYTLAKLRPLKGSKVDEDGEGVRKGSPLWDKKPDLQLFYNVSRDWARVYCPDVLLGIYSRDEILENARIGREDEPEALGLAERLQAAAPNGEGFQDGHAHRELSQIAPDRGSKTIDGEVTAEKGSPSPADGAPVGDPGKPATETPSPKTRASGRAKGPKAGHGRAPSAGEVKAAADRAERGAVAPDPAKTKARAQAAADRAEPVPEAVEHCRTPAAYIAYAKAWIAKSTKLPAAQDRFDEERDHRIRLQVPVKESINLQNAIDDKFAAE